MYFSPRNQLHVPEEGTADFDPTLAAVNPPQPSRQRRASEIPKVALKKVVKKVVPLKKPHLRRKGHAHHPQNRWVAFHSAGGGDDNEILSLFRGEHAADSSCPPSDQRRQSFDDRAWELPGKPSSRFQSLPDVKRFASEKGSMTDIWDTGLPQDDNMSTTNLLVLYEGADEDDDEIPSFHAPRIKFTGATPCPSSTTSVRSSLHSVEDKGGESQSPPELTFGKQPSIQVHFSFEETTFQTIAYI